MGVAAAVIAGVGLAASAAGTGYQIYSSNEAADEAEDAANEQKKKQDALIAEQKQADIDAKAAMDRESNNTEQRNSAAARARQMAQNAQGRSSTILTGPLGVIGSGNAAQSGQAGQANRAPGKTLLGM